MKMLLYCGIHDLVNFSRVRPYYDICYGFDANPDKIEQARKYYANDQGVKIIYGALTEKGGEEIEFFITTDWTQASSLGRPNPDYVQMQTGLLKAQNKIKVPTINLYEFCNANGISEIDTLITDLQGMDLTVLQTLSEFIIKGKIREIQCGVEPDNTPPRYLGIPPGKLKDFNELLSGNYDVLWMDSLEPPEDAWKMDVRWRVKGGKASDDLEFVMENELLVAKIEPSASLTTYSQYREDMVVDALFSHKRQGFYVDVGANDPDFISNTKFFYDKGWRGINVEPEPSLYSKLCAKRDRDINLNVGAGPETGVMTFYRMSEDTLSSFNKEAAIQAGKLYGATLLSEEQIQVMPLAEILVSNLKGMKIDLMSVDAEGYDLTVLKSNDWVSFQPTVIIVEINVEGNEIIEYLQKQGYILIFNNGTNGIFVTKEFCDTLDNHIRRDLTKLEQKHKLETFFPCSNCIDNILVNFVYASLGQEDNRVIHSGSISVIWSTLPAEGCDVYIYHNAFSYKGKQGGVDCLLMLEPVVVLPGEFDERVWKHFDHIFGPFDALTAIDNKFHKISFPRADLAGKNPVTEIQSQRESLYPLSGRKNAICMISGNKCSHVPNELYSKRLEAAQWFAGHSKMPFDVYGKPSFALPNYRGAIPDGEKLAVMKQYRYNLCFENTNHPVLSKGYVTEKILDCLETRTIPIYLGASNIEQYIPPECFIDFRKFADFRELDIYLHSLSEKKYKNYIADIDAFVCGGGLRNYSESALYNDVVKVLIDEKILDVKYFSNDIGWKPGLSPALRKREWKNTNGPTMWTWKHLSKADSPLLNASEMISTEKDTGSEIVNKGSKDSKLLRLSKNKTIKVLLACKKFSNGNALRGYDYAWWNQYDALCRFENVHVQFFDYVTEAQQRGVAGMSDRLLEIIGKEHPDVLFYRPFEVHADILSEALRSITDDSDTQTVVWMNDDLLNFDHIAQFWAPCVDYVITTSNEAVRKYEEAGLGPKIIKSQWAFNPFTYTLPSAIRLRDISFIGMAHGNRPEIIQQIRLSGLRVDVFGLGWSEDPYIPFHDMVRIFCQSKVNLNLSNTSAITKQQIKGRNFEVPGCRGFLITTPADNLEDCYEPNKEVVVASSLEELIEKSRYYLTNERERETIAQRGYERTLAEHTWTHRYVDIFQRIGLNAIASPSPPIISSSFLHRATPRIEDLHPPTGTDLLSINLADNDNVLFSVIVMAYNQLQFTRQCVESILHYTTGSYELLLIDNGSTDGTFEYFERMKSFHHNTRVIRNFQNRNVEATFNHTYSLARGKYIVSVTNDTIVHEGWLENFNKHIEASPDIGMVGPRSNNISGPQAMPAEYDTIEAYQTFAAEWSRQHRGESFPVERMVGMLVMIKQDVLKRMGGFDPDLPTNGKDGGYGFSDDDFSLRFRLAGYKSLVANDVFIHHFGSMTTRQYRPDLFGVPQNINKDKYLNKLQRNDRVTIGRHGEITVAPYGLDDHIPVAENTVIRSPRICIIANDAAGHQVNYSTLAVSYHGAAISFGENSIQRLLTQMMTSSEYDFVVLIANRLAPIAEKVQALVETALCFPDVAIMVPIGNFAPQTHAHFAIKEQEVEIIQYADMSCCVINVKLIRPLISILTQYGSDEEFYWFFQRRIRGESYLIAKANSITVDADTQCNSHPYDSHPLPERLLKNNKYAEAIAIYEDDLSKDPTFTESYYQLAHIAKEQQHTSNAVHYAVDALRIDPHHIQSLILLSKIFIEQGNLKYAESFVRQANFKQPGNPEVQALVAEYEKIISSKPSTVNIPPTAAAIASYHCVKTQKGPIASKKNKSKRRETSVRKVLLITPSFEVPHRSEGIQLDSHYPIGMACLSASLKQAGHNVTLLFLNDFPYEKCALIVANHIAVDKPDIVGFNMLSPNRVMCYELMDYIHSTYPSIKVAVGGIHATVMHDQLKERFPYADILKGECDYSFIEYCKTGQVTEIPVDDLNDLPIPDHAAFWNPYRTTVSLMTSRGCPYSCSFCVLEHISKRKVRYKSPEKVIEEIEYCCKALPGIKRFWIHDDNFLLDNKRAKEICRLIIEKGLNNYIYICSARVKPLDEELVDLLEKAGFVHVLFGLESGSPEILEKCRKKITQEDVLNAVKLFSKSRIVATFFLIVGLSGENDQTVQETIDFVNQMQEIKPIYYEDIGVAMVYPGTELYNISKGKGTLTDDYWLTYQPVPYFTAENSVEELFRFKAKILAGITGKNNTVTAIKRDSQMETESAVHTATPIYPQLRQKNAIEGMTSIIIPVQSIHLDECVSSIKKYTPEPYEIIFLDHDGSPKLKKHLSKTIKENSNYRSVKINKKDSFTQSLNTGFNESAGEYIVLLFDDVVVGEGWLADMLEFLTFGKNIGIVGPISDEASGIQRTGSIDFTSLDEWRAFRKRNQHRGIDSRNIDGFCMLFRRDLLIHVGLFDEIFLQDKHVYDDFCVRAVLDGYYNVIAGNVFVHNMGGINRLLSHDKILFNEKWNGLEPFTPLSEKVSIANAMESARSQYHKGAVDDAVITLIKQIGFVPEEKRLYYQLAEMLLAESRFQEALDTIKGISAPEYDATYYVLSGYGNEGLGLYEIAKELGDKALSIDSQSASALNLIGILAYRNNDMEKAEDHFLRAIMAKPSSGDPYTNMGMLRWKANQAEESLDFFERGFILSPDKGDLITSYYSAISSLKQYKRAEGIFMEAREAYPECKRILFLLIDIFLKQDKFPEAMEEVEKAMVQFGIDEGILSAALEIRRNIGPKSIVRDGSAKTVPTLSVCMIVKNEDSFLAQCLNSLSPIADEMIVVDTGSTDKTKEIAEAFGAQLYDFEWVNDFAVARNYSLSKAQGDWILVMDADEMISYQDYAKLRKLVSKRDKVAYNIMTRNYINRTAGDGWMCNDNKYIHEQAGRGWFPSCKVRLFPNNEKIRFEQPIHELVEYSLNKIGVVIQETPVPVHHYGELNAKKATEKDLQYYELGVRKMKESGGDFRSVWELAVQAGELGKTEEAIELWHKVLEFKVRDAAAYFNLANHYLNLGKYEDSFACSRKAYALDPFDQSAVLSYAMSEFLGGDINNTISALEGFLKGSDSQTSHVSLLAGSYLLNGEKDKCLKYLRGLVKQKYDCVHYLKDIAKSLITAGNLARAKSVLTAAIEIKFYDQETSALLEKCETGE